MPDYLEEGYPDRYYFEMTAGGDPVLARKRIGTVIGPQSTLLTGVVNLNIGTLSSGPNKGFPGAVSARNSVMAIDGSGAIVGGYDKARLVAGSIDYLPGPGPLTIDLGEHGKAGVMICYEIVFSGAVADKANRPDYIFNPSNDGWFGWWGPPQHLAQARMRAIEEGLPVLRSTTTGISAVIDADGVVVDSIASGKADAIEGIVPAAKLPTLFSQWGHALTLAWAALLLALGLLLPRVLALVSARG